MQLRVNLAQCSNQSINAGLCILLVQMRNLDMKEAEDVRRTLLDAAAQHGLVQA